MRDSVRVNPSAFAISVRADIARAEGRYDDAIRDLHLANQKVPGCPQCYMSRIAAAFDEAGKTDSAITYYERNLSVRRLGVHELGEGVERLAQLYEVRRDTVNAVRCYKRFVELWKDADAVLQPRVAAARARIAALGAHVGK